MKISRVSCVPPVFHVDEPRPRGVFDALRKQFSEIVGSSAAKKLDFDSAQKARSNKGVIARLVINDGYASKLEVVTDAWHRETLYVRKVERTSSSN